MTMEQIFILCSDGGNEAVHPHHLKQSKKCNENEPGRINLLKCGPSM